MRRRRTAEPVMLATLVVALSACPTTTTTTTTTSTSTTSTTSSTLATTTTIPPDHTPPSTPTGPTASPASCSQITVGWNAATDTGGSGLKGYNVYRNGSFAKQVLVPATSTADAGLAASTLYSYAVTAVDNAGNVSAPSATVSTNTPACPDTTAPSVPTGLTATASCGQIGLSWNAATDTGGSGLKGYNVYRNGAFLRLVAAPATSTPDAGLPAQTAYSYTVAAVDNAANASAASAAANATTPACASIAFDLMGFVPGVGTPNDVAVDTTTGRVFVASKEFGLSVVDASTPGAPGVLGAANPPFLGQRVAMSGALAVVGTRSLGMRVVDLANLAAPRTVGAIGGDVVAVALAGQTAYALLVVPGNPSHVDLAVVSVAVPASPTIVGRITLGVGGADLEVVGTRAYVAAETGGLQIVDVANPTAPVIVGAVDTPGTASAVAVAGSSAYVADGSAVAVVNVSNPASPALVASLPTSAASVAVVGNRLFAVDGLQLKTIDVTTPSAPLLLGSASAYGASRLDARGTTAFLASSNITPTQGGLYVWNVATPATPSVVANVADAFESRGVAQAGSLAVAAGAAKGMKVVDLANPSMPRVVGTLPGTAVAVALSGQTAYVLLLVPGNPSHVDLAVVAVGSQQPPVLRGQLALGAGGSVLGSDVEVVGSLAYVAAGMPKFQVVSVASATAPTLVGAVNLPDTGSSVAVSGHYAYVATGTAIVVIDVATPSAPTIVATLPTSASSLARSANRLYAIDFSQLKTIDLTTPTAPTLLAATGSYGAQGIAVEGNVVYLSTPGTGHADPMSGVRAVDLATPTAPQLLDHLQVPGATRALTVANGALYASDANGIIDTIDLGN